MKITIEELSFESFAKESIKFNLDLFKIMGIEPGNVTVTGEPLDEGRFRQSWSKVEFEHRWTIINLVDMLTLIHSSVALLPHDTSFQMEGVVDGIHQNRQIAPFETTGRHHSLELTRDKRGNVKFLLKAIGCNTRAE